MGIETAISFWKGSRCFIIDVGLVLGGCNFKVIACLYVFEMQRLTAKGIIRSFSMRQRRATVKPVTGIISDCDICGGFMFNAQRYMNMNDANFTPHQIRFPYEMKKVFDRILHELQYLDTEHPHHFTLDLDQLDRIFEFRFVQSRSYSFSEPIIELEYVWHIEFPMASSW